MSARHAQFARFAELLWRSFFTAHPIKRRTRRAKSPSMSPAHYAATLRSPAQRERLEILWKRIRAEFFPDRPDLDQYELAWSTRSQKRVLASCLLQKKRVVVARELHYPEHEEWLEPLLFHEMCHAVLGILERTRNGRHTSSGKRAWHGPEFKALVKLHPRTAALEQWIDSGGWHHAVRSDRAKISYKYRGGRV